MLARSGLLYKKGKTVALRWFVSYIVILLIPLLFSLLIYGISYNVIDGQISKIHGASMDQVRVEIDSRISEMQLILQQMAFNRDIQSATRIKSPQPADQLIFVNVIKDFQRIQLSYPYLDDIIVFLNSTGTAVSLNGHMSQELLYNLYFQNPDMNFGQFQKYIRQRHRQDILKMTKGSGAEYLFLIQTTLDNNLSEGNITMMLALQADMFQKSLQKSLWDEGILVFIMDEESEVVISSGDFMETELRYADLAEAETFHTISLDGQKYAVLARNSMVNSWKYVSLIPSKLLASSAGKIQRYTLIGLFFSLLGGLAFSYWMTKQNYTPLKRIIGAFEKMQKNTRPEENEFDWLEKQVQQVMRERGDTQHLLWSNLKTLQKFYIHTLLEKPFDPVNGLREMQNYQINMQNTHNAYNVVAIFSSADIPRNGVPPEQDSDHFNIIKYVIFNIFQEVAGKHFNVEMTDVGPHVAAVVSIPENNPQFLETLKEDILYSQQKIQEYFQSSVFAAVGGVYHGLEGIYYSNLEAAEALQYANSSGQQGILYYDNIRSMDSRYHYPIKVEQKIINLLCVGDGDSVCATMESIFAVNSRDGMPSANTIRCLAFDILATLLKGAEQAGYHTSIDFSVKHPDLISIPLIQEKLCEIARSICRAVTEKQQSKPARQLSGKVKEYIQENYHNPDLNISITGQHFEMTPTYLSGIFKEETGQSLLEYINEVRIERCKGFLMAGHSVVEIAEMTGFRGSGALIRVFKKITGLTPGQYKKLQDEIEMKTNP